MNGINKTTIGGAIFFMDMINISLNEGASRDILFELPARVYNLFNIIFNCLF